MGVHVVEEQLVVGEVVVVVELRGQWCEISKGVWVGGEAGG
jgi:hypothetical protein